MRCSVRDILNQHPLDLLAMDDTSWYVTYEDGKEIKERHRTVVFNRFCWDLFLLYEHIPVTSEHSVSVMLGDDNFDSSTHIKLLERIFKSICNHEGLVNYESKTPLIKAVFNVVNNIYNNLVCNIGNAVTSIDAEDFVDIHNSEEIRRIHSEMQPTPVSVGETYEKIKNFMKTDRSDNAFNKAYRAKAINENQANQCIGPRGFVTDVDRTVFNEPVRNGFIHGLDTLYELIVESLTATKAYNASNHNIQDSEYASRRFQILAMSVTKVDTECLGIPGSESNAIRKGDCGSQRYTELTITERRLANMSGTYYLDESNGELKPLTTGEKHLIGETIKIRTALSCQLENPAHVCAVCVGEIANNFKENSNPGYNFVSYVMEKMSQAMLSKKHITSSVMKELIKLDRVTERYFHVDEDDFFYFNKNVDVDKLTLVLPYRQVKRLIDAMNATHNNIGMSRIGELTEVGIYQDDPSDMVTIPVDNGDRNSILTREFLSFLRETEMYSDEKNNFVIPLKGFDKETPLFENLLKERDLLQFVRKVSSIVEMTGTAKFKKKLIDPEERMLRLFDSLIEHNDCNLSACGVIAYATTVHNPTEGNYNLGRHSPLRTSDNASMIIRNRSLSQFLIYEDQARALSDVNSVYSPKWRQGHPADLLFAPKEVLDSK